MNIGGFNVGGAAGDFASNVTDFTKHVGGITIELRTRAGSLVYDPNEPDAPAGSSGGGASFLRAVLKALDAELVLVTPAGTVSRRLT